MTMPTTTTSRRLRGVTRRELIRSYGPLAFLLMPVLMVVMPLSGIAGIVYALQYNRKGSRQRLFNKEDKQLPPPKKQLRP
jgi:hypothetical protein